jgi:hypothetical protein
MTMRGMKKALIVATASCVAALGFGGTATAAPQAPGHHVAVDKHPKKKKTNKGKHKGKHKGKKKGMKNKSGTTMNGPAAPSPAPGAGPNGHDLSRVIWPA